MIVLKVDSMIKVKVKNHMPRDSNYLAAGEAFPRTPDAMRLEVNRIDTFEINLVCYDNIKETEVVDSK